MGVVSDDITKVAPWLGFKLHIVENTVGHYVHQEQNYDETGVRLGKPQMHTLCNQNNHWVDIITNEADLTKYIRDTVWDLCCRPCIIQEIDEGRWCAIPTNPVHRYDNEIIYSYEIYLVEKQGQQE